MKKSIQWYFIQNLYCRNAGQDENKEWITLWIIFFKLFFDYRHHGTKKNVKFWGKGIIYVFGHLKYLRLSLVLKYSYLVLKIINQTVKT